MLNSEDLINKVKIYNKFLNPEKLNKAYNFAVKAHINQKRASGDPYSVHPIEVANILTELKLDNKPSRFISNEVNKINLENSNILVSIKGFYGLTPEGSKGISDSFILLLKESGKFKSVEISSAQKISKWKTNYEIELVL